MSAKPEPKPNNQSQPNSMIWLAVVVPAATLLLMFSVCCGGCLMMIGGSGSNNTDGAVVSSSDQLTKSEFVEKIQTLIVEGSYQPQYNLCHFFVSHKELVETFGEPDSDLSAGSYHRYWGYRCSDGSIQLKVVLMHGLINVQAIEQY